MKKRTTPMGGVRGLAYLVVSVWCAWLLAGGAASARDCLDYASYGGAAGDPPLCGGLVLDAEAVDVCLQAGHAYLACGEDGLHVVELSVPSLPVRVAIADLLGDVTCAAVYGDYVAAGVGSALKFVDVTAAAAPEWVSTLSAGGVVRDVIAAPPLALAVSGADLLTVVDLSASPQPTKLGVAVSAPGPRAAAAADGVVWVGGDSGLEAFSLLDPAVPASFGPPHSEHALKALAVDGSTLWAGTTDGRLAVYDVTDPSAPAVYRVHVLPSPAVSLRVDDGFLTWVGADGLTRIAGVGARGAYVPMGPLPTPGHARAVDGFGPYLVFADGEGGLQVGWHQCDLVLAAGRDREPRAKLLSTVPNPLNPGTTIIFSVSRPADVRLTLHDARGRAAAVLFEGFCDEGAHETVWDGRLADGRRAASGVWHVRLEAGRRVDMGSLVVLK